MSVSSGTLFSLLCNAFGFSLPGEAYIKMCENSNVVLLGETKERNKSNIEGI